MGDDARVELIPEHIHSIPADDEPSEAVVIDPWGRIHEVYEPFVIGREPGPGGLAIARSSVSRHHARIERADSGWKVVDLGSTNGTKVDGVEVAGTVMLANHSVITIDDVRLVFLADGDGAHTRETPDIVLATRRRAEPDATALPLRVLQSTRGGVVEYAGRQVTLGVAQFALVEILAERQSEQVPAEVRGFVSSAELLADIPWNTPYPTENHVKQMVRRVRRALEEIGVKSPIESVRGLGYRLSLVAERSETPSEKAEK